MTYEVMRHHQLCLERDPLQFFLQNKEESLIKSDSNFDFLDFPSQNSLSCMNETVGEERSSFIGLPVAESTSSSIEIEQEMNGSSENQLSEESEYEIQENIPKKRFRTKKGSGLKKIKTFPTFLVRMFFANFSHAQNIIQADPQIITAIQAYITATKSNRFFILQNLEQLFNNGSGRRVNWSSTLNRQIMSKIMSKVMRKQIIQNKNIINKHSYLNNAKVYNLRCRNGTLTTRLQSQ